jgi:hypothetical protein
MCEILCMCDGLHNVLCGCTLGTIDWQHGTHLVHERLIGWDVHRVIQCDNDDGVICGEGSGCSSGTIQGCVRGVEPGSILLAETWACTSRILRGEGSVLQGWTLIPNTCCSTVWYHACLLCKDLPWYSCHGIEKVCKC